MSSSCEAAALSLLDCTHALSWHFEAYQGRDEIIIFPFASSLLLYLHFITSLPPIRRERGAQLPVGAAGASGRIQAFKNHNKR